MQDAKEIINVVVENSPRNTPVVPTISHLVRIDFLTAALALVLTRPFRLYRLRTGLSSAALWNPHRTTVAPSSP